MALQIQPYKEYNVVNHFISLPDELVIKILSYLTDPSFNLVCVRFAQIFFFNTIQVYCEINYRKHFHHQNDANLSIKNTRNLFYWMNTELKPPKLSGQQSLCSYFHFLLSNQKKSIKNLLQDLEKTEGEEGKARLYSIALDVNKKDPLYLIPTLINKMREFSYQDPGNVVITLLEYGFYQTAIEILNKYPSLDLSDRLLTLYRDSRTLPYKEVLEYLVKKDEPLQEKKIDFYFLKCRFISAFYSNLPTSIDYILQQPAAATILLENFKIHEKTIIKDIPVNSIEYLLSRPIASIISYDDVCFLLSLQTESFCYLKKGILDNLFKNHPEFINNPSAYFRIFTMIITDAPREDKLDLITREDKLDLINYLLKESPNHELLENVEFLFDEVLDQHFEKGIKYFIEMKSFADSENNTDQFVISHEMLVEKLKKYAQRGDLKIFEFFLDKEKCRRAEEFSEKELGEFFKAAANQLSIFPSTNIDLIKYLVEQPEFKNVSNLDIHQAFFLACKNNRVEIISYLLGKDFPMRNVITKKEIHYAFLISLISLSNKTINYFLKHEFPKVDILTSPQDFNQFYDTYSSRIPVIDILKQFFENYPTNEITSEELIKIFEEAVTKKLYGIVSYFLTECPRSSEITSEELIKILEEAVNSKDTYTISYFLKECPRPIPFEKLKTILCQALRETNTNIISCFYSWDKLNQIPLQTIEDLFFEAFNKADLEFMIQLSYLWPAEFKLLMKRAYIEAAQSDKLSLIKSYNEDSRFNHYLKTQDLIQKAFTRAVKESSLDVINYFLESNQIGDDKIRNALYFAVLEKKKDVVNCLLYSNYSIEESYVKEAIALILQKDSSYKKILIILNKYLGN